MLKFDDPQFIAKLHKLSDELKNKQLEALDGKRYAELAKLNGIEQGLILAIEIARGKSARVPQIGDVPFLGAHIATLYEDG